MVDNAILQAIEKPSFLDDAVEPVQRGVKNVLDRVPAVRDALHGTWLGHPLHAALVSLPVGAFTIGFIFDLYEVLGRSKKYRSRADAVVGIGLAAVLPTALAGITDFSYTKDPAKRVAFVHGLTNTVIGGLYGASLLARSRKRRTLGIALSSSAYGLLMFSAWLGGELSYRFGVGVRPEAIEREQGGEAGLDWDGHGRRVAAP